MKRPTPESVKLATYIHEFLTGYAPVHLTTSEHTLKNYKTSLSLYLVFLQEECGITPSMSRRGHSYDNAMAENFFSILKTECIYRQKFATLQHARQLIDDFIYFYNHVRIQLKTGVAPLALCHSA